jgi:uncharacterized protein YdiU (UPF0061 family)
VSLSCIVRGPVLRIGLTGDFDGLCDNGLTGSGLFAFNRVFDGEDMLTLIVSEFIISASALWFFIRQSNGVLLLLVGLRRYVPRIALAD